jgi:hypothetical protein
MSGGYFDPNMRAARAQNCGMQNRAKV